MFLAERSWPLTIARLDMLNVKYLMVSQPGPEFDLIAASDRFAPCSQALCGSIRKQDRSSALLRGTGITYRSHLRSRRTTGACERAHL